MENKINIAEILKDCPKGMELDCTVYNNVTLEYVHESSSLPICIRIQNRGTMFLSKYGQLHDEHYCKCIIFPKDKTTWEGFKRPFKDGDILTNKFGKPFILKAYLPEMDNIWSYCGIDCSNKFNKSSNNWTFARSVRFATEEEKEILFQAIKDNGYKWNAETKTLEKLVTNKFDITTLKTFESKVLVRDADNYEWEAANFGRYDGKRFFVIGGIYWNQCIPFEGNEHLLGTTDDCDEFYKTWE